MWYNSAHIKVFKFHFAPWIPSQTLWSILPAGRSVLKQRSPYNKGTIKEVFLIVLSVAFPCHLAQLKAQQQVFYQNWKNSGSSGSGCIPSTWIWLHINFCSNLSRMLTFLVTCTLIFKVTDLKELFIFLYYTDFFSCLHSSKYCFHCCWMLPKVLFSLSGKEIQLGFIPIL